MDINVSDWWCVECIYASEDCKCMCTKPCSNASQRIEYHEEEE